MIQEQTHDILLTSYTSISQRFNDIQAIDYFFAKEVCQTITNENRSQISLYDLDVLAVLFMALSAHIRVGHTCLAVDEIADTAWGRSFDDGEHCTHEGFIFPTLCYLNNLLLQCEFSPENNGLVVFSFNKLYMRRYYNFEQSLMLAINTRLKTKTRLPEAALQSCMQSLFSQTDVDDVLDWQKIAVANALNKDFTVIAGGPGTGKTYTVTKLLAALVILSQEDHNERALKIALVAPTGKAAQRLSESILKAIAGFKQQINHTVLAKIPHNAQTIHRLLGVIPNSPNFRHDEKLPLDYDVVLIDEASMVDLPMMTRLFRALKPETKVIMLGDADQLPSVAVGSVLADIAPRPHCGYSQSNYRYLAQVCGLDKQMLIQHFAETMQTPCDYLSFLVNSRRFDSAGGIGKLAKSVIQGESENSWQLLTKNLGDSQIHTSQLALVEGALSQWLTPLIKLYYQQLTQCDTLTQAFAALAKFRILCVTRQGEFGVEAINQWVKDFLYQKGKHAANHDYLHGMPIMISENNYQLNLFNGDIGLIWHDKEHDIKQPLKAYFEQPPQLQEDGTTSIYHQGYLLSRLPKFELVYAMTIHKTQGSEFDHVAMIIPNTNNSQLLSRELLYTGITRAKSALTISSTKQIWQQGVDKRVHRHSGITLTQITQPKI